VRKNSRQGGRPDAWPENTAATKAKKKNSRVLIEGGHLYDSIICRFQKLRWLFLSDVDYPGWRAWVDGSETRIHRADYIFRAVFLPKGDHSIRFRYRPISFRTGLWVSVGSLFAACILGLAKIRDGHGTQ